MTKNLLPIVLGLAGVLSLLRADDITLTDGTVLKNAKIVQRDDSTKTVTISFSGGITQVHSEMVPALPATAHPPAVPTADSQTTPVPQPPKPSSPSTPKPTDWTVNGKTLHNVKVGQVEADRVHITYDGGVGTVALADLPPDLQKKFNYDPVKAQAMADERNQQVAQYKAEVGAKYGQEFKDDAAQAAQIQAQQNATRMFGRVFQKIPGGGLLVSCSAWGIPADSGVAIESDYDEFVFMLKGMPNEADIVDDGVIREVVYRSGNYSYTSAMGVTKTVAAYTAVRDIPLP